MSPKAQRIAIALACGAKWYLYASGWTWLSFKELSGPDWKPVDCPINSAHVVIGDTVPDYLSDLNAILDAVRRLPIHMQVQHYRILGRIVGVEEMESIPCAYDYRRIGNATAAQHSEAFIRNHSLWDESK